ncbi:unnamed protein product [Didymodactylos carnosus]|uniref:RING-type domain-containing protein n=1 Tax=Didymodactylos carnosus TaxID=1234261 RepID=A0A813X8B5_9BILA|nr:unnamed protein product [Didymodactylos carnosus]CAF0864594.1 unnamed protein product [Didymodactylos carnosus]CAF3640711.1 unnamed protein product [Didymodactylos carnosus]CAF3652121.1 unnamed protein product [Didymodactylos carnosus]
MMSNTNNVHLNECATMRTKNENDELQQTESMNSQICTLQSQGNHILSTTTIESQGLPPRENDPFETSNAHNSSVEVIDAAHADDSDSWTTDDEGDFYSNNENLPTDEDDDENQFGEPGLSNYLINIYPVTTAEESSCVGKLCDICLNEYKETDKLRLLPCLHRFHVKCIDKWLKVS